MVSPIEIIASYPIFGNNLTEMLKNDNVILLPFVKNNHNNLEKYLIILYIYIIKFQYNSQRFVLISFDKFCRR